MKSGKKRKRARGGLTLHDVAQRAGVSASTVSATLNNAPRAQHYAPETKKRIHEAAQELGYIANPLAKTLKRSRSGFLGVVAFSQYGIYYAQLLEAAQAEAEQLGYEIVTADMRYEADRLEKCINLLLAWSVEGVFLLTGGHKLASASLQRLAGVNIPVVTGGLQLPDLPFSCITFSFAQAGRLLAQHLLDLGHRSIGVLAAKQGNFQSEERIEGIKASFLEAGFPLNEVCILRAVDSDVGVAAGYRYADELLERDPALTAILCHSDLMAIGAMSRLREKGLRIPEDISVTGFDDLCLDASLRDENRLGLYLAPALTTIRTPHRPMGREAMASLVEAIKNKHAPQVRKVLEFSPELIVRGSTGAPRQG